MIGPYFLLPTKRGAVPTLTPAQLNDILLPQERWLAVSALEATELAAPWKLAREAQPEKRPTFASFCGMEGYSVVLTLRSAFQGPHASAPSTDQSVSATHEKGRVVLQPNTWKALVELLQPEIAMVPHDGVPLSETSGRKRQTAANRYLAWVKAARELYQAAVAAQPSPSAPLSPVTSSSTYRRDGLRLPLLLFSDTVLCDDVKEEEEEEEETFTMQERKAEVTTASPPDLQRRRTEASDEARSEQPLSSPSAARSVMPSRLTAAERVRLTGGCGHCGSGYIDSFGNNESIREFSENLDTVIHRATALEARAWREGTESYEQAQLLSAPSDDRPWCLAITASSLAHYLRSIFCGVTFVTSTLPWSLAAKGIALLLPLSSTLRHKNNSLEPPSLLLELHHNQYQLDTQPLLPGCSCYTCTHHTRAYLHHLLTVQEMNSEILLVIHNLTVMVQAARAIRYGGDLKFREWIERWMEYML